MKTYSIDHPDKGLITYNDKKRPLWIISILFPFMLPMIGVGLCLYTGRELALAIPLFIAYVVIPLLDALVGEDLNNPPEELVPQLEEDPYYAWMTYLTVPLHVLTLCLTAWFVTVTPLGWGGLLLAALVCGLSNGFAINTAHELGHKYGNRVSLNFAKVALAVPFYGHFNVEHNRGHHRWVATPEDPASSRLGESIYRFMFREIYLTWLRGLELERDRLKKKKKSFWTLDNQVLQSYAMSVILQGAILALCGWRLLPFLLVHNFFAWFQLTSANYIEHYGLLRGKNESGRYEPTKPHHSWNSNHILSNLTPLT